MKFDINLLDYDINNYLKPSGDVQDELIGMFGMKISQTSGIYFPVKSKLIDGELHMILTATWLGSEAVSKSVVAANKNPFYKVIQFRYNPVYKIDAEAALSFVPLDFNCVYAIMTPIDPIEFDKHKYLRTCQYFVHLIFTSPKPAMQICMVKTESWDI